jgi:tetratricopeptide (TPR) repeat protein
MCTSSSFSADRLKDWDALILKGDGYEVSGFYDLAQAEFQKAVVLAETNKLPSKCLPIALCRLIRDEVMDKKVLLAEPHFAKLVKLVNEQKNNGTLDGDAKVWMVDTSDSYMARQEPATRELCLKNGCKLKALGIGSNKETYNAMFVLAQYYADQNRVQDAVRVVQAVSDSKRKKTGQDDSAMSLYQMACTCRADKKFDTAKQLTLAATENLKSFHSAISAALPVLYTYAGLNAMDNNEPSVGQKLFSQSIASCKDLKETKDRLNAKVLTQQLISNFKTVSKKDKRKSLESAVSEFQQILLLEQTLDPIDIKQQYAMLNKLGDTYGDLGNLQESEKYLERAAQIAKLPNSYCSKDLPDINLRIALHRGFAKKLDLANQAFAKTLQEEPDKKGFHSGLVLLYWGCLARENGNYSLAAEKLKLAQNLAQTLPPSQRGTLLADTFFMLGAVNEHEGKKRDAADCRSQSTKEVELQKRLRTKLGPDFFHRVNS